MAWFTAADSKRMDDLRRADWPAHAIECWTCNGSGGDFDQHERCHACLGRGFNVPACVQCRDTGLVPEIDPEGNYDGDYPCDCDAGRALMTTTAAIPFVAGAVF